MRLEDHELAIIKEEALAMADELDALSPERAERRCRLLQIILTEADWREAAEAARHTANCYATGRDAKAGLIEILKAGKR